MRRSLAAMTMLLGGALFPMETAAQARRTAIDCTDKRLISAEMEICSSPELKRLNDDIGKLTSRLEKTLTGSEREALLDTEGPFEVQRNSCQNETLVRECTERILEGRMNALKTAARSPASIRNEITQYTIFHTSFFRKYADLLIGKRVSVWGCMTVGPGPTPAGRIHGNISESCPRTRGAYVPVIFKSMDETSAVFFYDAKRPISHWEGTIERHDGRLVLAQVDP